MAGSLLIPHSSYHGLRKENLRLVKFVIITVVEMQMLIAKLLHGLVNKYHAVVTWKGKQLRLWRFVLLK